MRPVARRLGGVWVDPGVKSEARAREKLVENRKKGIPVLTDGVRGSLVVPDAADLARARAALTAAHLKNYRFEPADPALARHGYVEKFLLRFDHEVVDLGMDLGVDLGVDLGMDLGVDLGMDLGVDLGMDLGVDLGMDLGVDLGVDTERHSFAEIQLHTCQSFWRAHVATHAMYEESREIAPDEPCCASIQDALTRSSDRQLVPAREACMRALRALLDGRGRLMLVQAETTK